LKEIDLDNLGESDKKPEESVILGMGVIRKTSHTQAKVTFGHDTLACIQGPNLSQVRADLDQETPSLEPSLGPLSDPKLFG
jgi:Cu/Ag efflux protein CusF